MFLFLISSVVSYYLTSAQFKNEIRGKVLNENPLSRSVGYKLGSKLGSGTYGEVYSGYHKNITDPLAIKIIGLSSARYHYAVNEVEITKFLQDLEYVPNLPRYYQYYVHNNKLFLMMENLPGNTLSSHVHADLDIREATASQIIKTF